MLLDDAFAETVSVLEAKFLKSVLYQMNTTLF